MGSSSVLALNFGHSGDNNEGLIYFNTTSGSENLQLESSKHITFRAGASNVANNISFKSYNTDIMTIDGSNNRVGIGITQPGQKLSVVEGSSAIGFGEYSNGATIWMDGSNGDFSGGDYFGIHANGTTNLDFSYAGSNKVTIRSTGKVGIGTTSPFASLHIKNTGWSSGSPYGTVQLIEGNNVNDANWGHLVITDTTTANGNGGAISFGTGASSSLNPFAGIKGTAEGTSYGGLTLLTRPTGGTAVERYNIKSTGRHMFYGMNSNSSVGSYSFGHTSEGGSGGYMSSWTTVFGHRIHLRNNNGSNTSSHGTTSFSGSGANNFRIMQNMGYNGVYWNASTDTGAGTSTEAGNANWYWSNTNSVNSGAQYTVTNRMHLNASGNLYITGSLTQNTTISDARLKQDIEEFPLCSRKNEST